MTEVACPTCKKKKLKPSSISIIGNWGSIDWNPLQFDCSGKVVAKKDPLIETKLMRCGQGHNFTKNI